MMMMILRHWGEVMIYQFTQRNRNRILIILHMIMEEDSGKIWNIYCSNEIITLIASHVIKFGIEKKVKLIREGRFKSQGFSMREVF